VPVEVSNVWHHHVSYFESQWIVQSVLECIHNVVLAMFWMILNSKYPFVDPTPSPVKRTPATSKEEMKDEPAVALRRFIPEATMETFFGPREDQNPSDKDTLEKVAATRDHPPLSVYVISTNEENEEGIKFLFSEMPCRLVKLRSSDLLTQEQGCYPGMGADRAATVAGAINLFPNRPVLIIDGGKVYTK
jgi:hypothetical protein